MLLMTVTQKCDLTIQPVDVHGNPARIDGEPRWSIADETLLSLDVATGGMKATISAIGPIGETQVNVVADADLGEGIRELAGALGVKLLAGEAASLGISAGTPEEQ